MSDAAASLAREAMIRSWDVLVIGAGPAGSVAAFALARAGRSVLLVERCEMPRPKVCGCCLAPGGVQALRECGLGATLGGAARVEYCSIRAGRSRARAPSPGYRVIGRDAFDLRLATAARDAGAVLLQGWSARVATDGAVRLSNPDGAGLGVANPGMVIRPRVVIAADGLGGASLAERPEFGWSIKTRSRMGVGTVLPRSPVTLAEGEISMLCGGAGYLGVVRLPTGAIIAAAALDPAAVRNGGGPGELCARIVAGCGGDPEAVRDASWRGAPLLTRRRACVESEEIFVIGDGAGYVEPFTGEGMTWAIEGALSAARIVGEVLDGRAARGAWTSMHRELVRAEHKRCGVVARLVRHELMMRAAVGMAGRWPSIGRTAVGVLGPGCAGVPIDGAPA